MNDRNGYPIGSLVETTRDCAGPFGVRGLIVQSWTPTVYDMRSYTVALQETGERVIFYANELQLVESKKTS